MVKKKGIKKNENKLNIVKYIINSREEFRSKHIRKAYKQSRDDPEV